VLVHQHGPQLRRIHRPPDRIHPCHGPISPQKGPGRNRKTRQKG
jgi:hypothetical protein